MVVVALLIAGRLIGRGLVLRRLRKNSAGRARQRDE
jgi:hypothetical protein